MGRRKQKKILFNELSSVKQRFLKSKPISINIGKLSKKEELEVFNLINYGGIIQGEQKKL